MMQNKRFSKMIISKITLLEMKNTNIKLRDSLDRLNTNLPLIEGRIHEGKY